MLTIIVPTYNRADRLARLLNYYRATRCPCPIVIADSSAAEHREANSKLISSLRDTLDLHRREFDPATPYARKMADVLATVQTRYTVLSADDDFVIWHAAKRCAAFLEEHPDYAVAHGLAVTMAIMPEADGTDTQSIRVRPYPQRAVEADDPARRLKQHMSNYFASFYSVHRSKDIQQNYKLVAAETRDYRFGELLESCLSMIQGKAKRLDMLYMARESSLESASPQTITLEDLRKQKDYQQRYGRFRDCLAAELQVASDIGHGEARRTADKAFAHYRKWLSRKKGTPAGWVRTARAALRTVGLLGIARRLAGPKAEGQRHRPNELSLKSLLDPACRFHADFMPIYEHFKAWIERPQRPC